MQGAQVNSDINREGCFLMTGPTMNLRQSLLNVLFEESDGHLEVGVTHAQYIRVLRHDEGGMERWMWRWRWFLSIEMATFRNR